MPLAPLHIVGFKECQYSQRALQAADILQHSGLVDEVSTQIFEQREEYLQWLGSSRSESPLAELGPEAQKHTTSPICWSEEDGYIGGCTEFEALAASLLDVNITPVPALDDGGASLGRFKEIVKSHKFTVWIFWRGLW